MCPFPVRVLPAWSLGDFLGSLITAAVRLPGGSRYCRARHGLGDLPPFRIPTPFNGLFRLSAGVPLLRLPLAAGTSNGMFTVSSIGCAFRLRLRSRLTLIRLALIRNPWSFGVGVSRPHYRYLYLHLLFRRLHRGSVHGFSASRNAPLPTRPSRPSSTSSAPGFMPDYYPRGTARLVSCYALFK